MGSSLRKLLVLWAKIGWKRGREKRKRGQQTLEVSVLQGLLSFVKREPQ
jgi:hypothetical protein